ncbi:MAG: hypothetical protein GF383_12455 [Candidatus Lokiarchaeota archaeon]|nr:hypothetical protein [Candidatus Lokiarchaeota archaeon]MBD3341813.1 hypothetical protein [Candidatus Lokiarchaeota archaeon]
MKRPLNIGLIGYGINALGHKMELEQHPKLQGRTKVKLIFDPDPKARKSQESNEEIRFVESFEDVLDTDDLNAVIISSPPQYHAEQAITALESGLHVYSEIPMSIKEEKIEKIINAEEASGKKYQLGENYCFYPEVLYAASLVSSGRIGPTLYAESEYLHDVLYRWREGGRGDLNTPRVDSWYQQFDPLMYAHTIGPAQIALGGLETPQPFVEVTSYANDIGGHEGKPICSPAKAFHIGLFRTKTNAIAKCANAYIIAREPSRISIQVVGRYGTYECHEIGNPGYLFLAKDHVVTRSKHRKGKRRIVDQGILSEIVEPIQGLYYGAQIRIMDDWLSAIEKDKTPLIDAKTGANFCHAGIAASKSARSGGKPTKIKIYDN